MKESQQSYQRYPRYFRVLRTLLVNGIMKVSSVELGRYLNITPSTVRADLNRFSGVGQQGYGYNVKLLYTGISRELGAGDNMSAVIIGGDAAFAKRLAERFEGRGVTVSCFFPDIGEGDGKTGIMPDHGDQPVSFGSSRRHCGHCLTSGGDECRYACFPRDKGNLEHDPERHNRAGAGHQPSGRRHYNESVLRDKAKGGGST